jgi:hypothetical protein
VVLIIDSLIVLISYCYIWGTTLYAREFFLKKRSQGSLFVKLYVGHGG